MSTGRNVQTHTGTVHAARYEADGRPAPACTRSARGLHYAHATSRPVTCGRCLGTSQTPRTTAPRPTREARAAAAAQQQAETAARKAATIRGHIAFLTDAVTRLEATDDPRATAARAELADLEAELAALETTPQPA